MSKTNKTWQNILYICVLLTAICVLFYWYSTTNNRRIEKQNLNYAMDSAKQTSHSSHAQLFLFARLRYKPTRDRRRDFKGNGGKRGV